MEMESGKWKMENPPGGNGTQNDELAGSKLKCPKY